jgi:type III secretory pathway component EscV
MQAKSLPMYVIAGAAVALVAVVAGVPLASFLPFAIILLCPLMMFFMMRNMGGMHGGGEDRSERKVSDDHAGHDRTGSHHQ